MVIDTATSGTQTPAKHSLPELEIYCYLLILIFLIDQKRYSEVWVYDYVPPEASYFHDV